MAVMIDWDNRVILQCSNGIMSGLYDSILDLMYEKNLSFNETISELIDRLETASRGIGFDLADYINLKEDFITFTNLVRNAIDKLNYDIPGLPETTNARLEGFYKELLNIQNNFENH